MLASRLSLKFNGSVEGERPWHAIGFIPELSFRAGEEAINGWRNFLPDRDPLVVLVNYIDLWWRRYTSVTGLAELRDLLSPADAVILSCVGEDRDLDRLNITEYHRIAVELGAKAVITPEDYIYAVDRPFPLYQWSRLNRCLVRMEEIVGLSQGNYDVIGLPIGEIAHQRVSMQRFLEHGITDVALACGDLLWQGSFEKAVQSVRGSLALSREYGFWTLLLGASSCEFVQVVRPDCFSSSSWAFRAYHGKHPSRDPQQLTLNGSDPQDSPAARAALELRLLQREGEQLRK